MKILFLSAHVDAKTGASILIRLVDRLKLDGHEVRIVTTSNGYDSDVIRSVKLPKWLDLINRILNRLVPNYFSLIGSRIAKEVQAFYPDVINIHWTHGGRIIPISIIPKLNQHYPVFWTIHDMWPITTNSYFKFTGGKTLLRTKKGWFRNTMQRIELSPEVLFRYKVHLLEQSNIHTISPSKWLQHKVEKSPVFRGSTNHHIPNGVDSHVFKPMQRDRLRNKYCIAENEKVILFLSSNLADKRKGFYYLVKALETIKQANPELIENITTLLIGENSKGGNKYLPTKVINLGSTSNPSKLVEYYNLADIFVSASLADNFPSTSLESLACGTPVVAFDVGGVSEIILDRTTGLLAKSADHMDLADNMVEILTDECLRKKLGFNCRKYAVDKFNIDKFVDGYLGLFKILASKKH